MKEIAVQTQNFTLGVCEEYNVRRILFDISEYRRDFGDGTPVLLVTRPGESQNYPLNPEVEDDYAIWVPQQRDMDIPGTATIVLQWYVEGGLAISTEYYGRILGSKSSTCGEAPEAEERWYRKVLQAGTDVISIAKTAEAAAERAEVTARNIAGSMDAASKSAESAVSAAERAAAAADRVDKLAAESLTKGYADETFAKQSDVFETGLKPTFTNVLPLSQNTAGDIQNELGYTYVRISGTGIEEDAANWVSTGYIPVKQNDVLRFENFGLPIGASSYCRMLVYKSDHTVASQGQVNGYNSDSTSSGMNYIMSPTGGTNTVVLDEAGANIVQMTICRPSTMAYVRFTVPASGVSSKAVITVNEEIAYEAGYGTKLNNNIQVDSSQIVGDLGQRSPWDILPGAHLAIAYSNIGRMAINTKEHFQDCCKNYGYNVLKCDVRPTSDGEIVLCHDAGFTLDTNGRITTYNAANSTSIHEMTAAQCVALEHADSKSYGLIGYYAKPCLIGDYLDVCRAYGKVAFITIRDEYMDVVIPKLLEELRARNMMYHTIINSMTYASLVKWRDADSIVCLNYTLSRGANVTSTEIDQVIDLRNAMIGGFGFGGTSNESDITCDFTYANEKKIRVINAIGYVSGAYENCIATGYDGLHIGYSWGKIPGIVTDDHINELIDKKLRSIENGTY